MRVLHVHSGNIWGGIETFLATLARHERAVSTMRSTFALCFEGDVADRLRAEGADVRPLAPVRLSRPVTVVRARVALDGVVAAVNPHVIAIHSSWTAAVFGGALSAAGRPVALWAHAPNPGPSWQRVLARRCPVDLVIANSRYTLESRPRPRPGTRTARVYYPVSPPLGVAPRTRTRASLGVPDDEPVIVIAARLERWKGHRLLLEALALLPLSAGPWHCWIAGGPQRPDEHVYEQTLREFTARAGLTGSVRFLGRRSDVPDLLAAADIYCQPNIAPEPFGISFIEALCAGLPVVSSRIGAAVELIDSTCGRLAGACNAAQLAAELGDLLQSPSERARLGAAGQARAAALCAPDLQIPRIEALLGSLMGTSTSVVS